MKRARQKHQKEERREAILSFAKAELEASPYTEITMSRIADRAGLVKGTLYLYFATKEELFLELLRDELHGWFWDLETGLDDLPQRGRLEALARLLTRSLASLPSLRRLLALMHAHLLTNLPEGTTLAFRSEWHARTTFMGTLLERALPFLHAGQGLGVLRAVIALAIGGQSLGTPMEEAAETGADFFCDGFQEAVTALLRGIREGNRPTT